MEVSNNPAQMWSSCLGSTILRVEEEPGAFQTSRAETKIPLAQLAVQTRTVFMPPLQCFAVTEFLWKWIFSLFCQELRLGQEESFYTQDLFPSILDLSHLFLF